MPIRFDRSELRRPQRHDSGFIRVDAYISRVGIQEYKLGDGKIRRELRPREEVFDAASLESFAGVPVTLNHPPRLITAKDAKSFSVGAVGEVVTPEDTRVRTSLAIHHADAISDVLSGKSAEVSCGYSCDLDETPGVWEGQRYDAIQRNIRGNHVALVTRGRAGPDVRIRLDAADGESIDQESDDMDIREDADVERDEKGRWKLGGGKGEKAAKGEKSAKGETPKKSRSAGYKKPPDLSIESGEKAKSWLEKGVEKELVNEWSAWKSEAENLTGEAKSEATFIVRETEREIREQLKEIKSLGGIDEMERQFAEFDKEAARSKKKKKKDSAEEDESATTTPEEAPTMKKIRLDGAEFEVDGALATAITAQLSRADSLQAKLDAQTEELTATKAKLDAATDPKAVAAVVAARVALEGSARKVLGAEAKLDGLTDKEVKLQVLAKVRPSTKMDDKSDAYVDGAFEMALEAKTSSVAGVRAAAHLDTSDESSSSSAPWLQKSDPEAARQRMLERRNTLAAAK